jgi:MscS family membrane protein
VRFFLLFFLLFVINVFAKEALYPPFIEKQIELTLALDDNNISEKKIEEILDQKAELFEQKLEDTLANKEEYLQSQDRFAKKIYKLNRIIAINKRRGNNYAVLRDEVLVKSYQILQSQDKMFIKILRSLDAKTYQQFLQSINEAFAKNQAEISTINTVDYKPYLEYKGNGNPVIRAMKQRIEEYYAILEINAEVLKFVIDSSRKMYRLNKYYKYGLIKPALYINHSAISKLISPILQRFNLSSMKVLMIVSIIIIFYILKKLYTKGLLVVLQKLHVRSFLAKRILEGVSKPLDLFVSVVGLNLILYVYNDFSRIAYVSAFLDMVYITIVMWSVYKVLNIIATAKIDMLVEKTSGVKQELINIAIKIINFTIALITVLIILHLAGVNLTAILSGLGIGGFAIALAAKDSLANFFGTLSILMSDTFSQGDWIVIEDIEGIVVEIGLRVTTIRTFDNALISIPNSKLSNEAIKNWSRRKIGRRIKFTVGVRYDSSVAKLEKTLQDIKNFLAQHPDLAREDVARTYLQGFKAAKLVSKDDALGIKNLQLVMIDQLADSSINIMVYCFSTTTKWLEWAKIKDDVIFGVMKIIEENGLDFAFPSLSIYPEGKVEVSLENPSNATIPATVQQN